MLMDNQLQLSNAQAITAASTYVSTNTIDLTVARDTGGMDLEFVCQVAASLTGGTNVTVQLIVSPNADLSSPVILVSSRAYLTAELLTGVEIMRCEVPWSLIGAQQRYLGCQYVSTGTYGAGSLTSELVLDRLARVPYPSGLNMGGF